MTETEWAIRNLELAGWFKLIRIGEVG